LKIPLEDLKPGKYSGTIFLQADETSEERDFEFVLYSEPEEHFFLFSNPEEEYQLMRYFLGSKLPNDWKDASYAKKRRYGTQFWKNLAATIKRSVPDALKLIQERVDYANKFFGHQKAGWTSDMGRIYIRNGAADDIQRETSSDESRFVRKDYQIWKYTTGQKPVYMFIDIQMNGNYRLIYVENDDMEASNPDWMRFVGADFDTNLLNN
jgi:GWxTD domain-containing protein